jgi:hypothetical protein
VLLFLFALVICLRIVPVIFVLTFIICVVTGYLIVIFLSFRCDYTSNLSPLRRLLCLKFKVYTSVNEVVLIVSFVSDTHFVASLVYLENSLTLHVSQ